MLILVGTLSNKDPLNVSWWYFWDLQKVAPTYLSDLLPLLVQGNNILYLKMQTMFSLSKLVPIISFNTSFLQLLELGMNFLRILKALIQSQHSNLIFTEIGKYLQSISVLAQEDFARSVALLNFDLYRKNCYKSFLCVQRFWKFTPLLF